MAKDDYLVIPLMKHILFFVESLSGGGAEKVLVTLLRHLDQRKYSITLVALMDTGVLREEIDTEKINYRPVIRPSSNPFVSLWNKAKYKLIYKYLPSWLVCKWIIPQKGVDLYIAFTEGFATKLLAFAPGPKLAWVHIDLSKFPWPLEKQLFRDILEESDIYRRFNKVVCVSNSVEIAMKRNYGLTNTLTILNPIDVEEIRAKAQSKSQDNLHNNCFRIVSVGRLSRQKGYEKLIPLIGRLRDKHFNISLYLIGEGEDYPKLKKMAEDLNLDRTVYFTGYLKNPYAIMGQMDLFVCSSLAEGFSLAIAEALCLGLPVISMNCSGPDLLLDGGNYGILCKDYDDLYIAIEKAITDRTFLNLLRDKAKSRAAFFNISEILRQIESLFDDTICRNSAS